MDLIGKLANAALILIELYVGYLTYIRFGSILLAIASPFIFTFGLLIIAIEVKYYLDIDLADKKMQPYRMSYYLLVCMALEYI